MGKIKKGMMELEETKRVNKELYKIYQEQEQTFRSYPSVNSVSFLLNKSLLH